MTRYVFNDGAGDGMFSNAGNWSPGGGPPGADDVAVFTSQNDVIDGNGTVGRLLVNAPTSIAFKGSLSVLGLTAGASLLVGNNAEVMFDPGSMLTVAGRLSVETQGELRFDGSALTTDTTVIGGAANSSGSISITDSLWNAKATVTVGAAGSGQLSVGAGAVLNLGDRPHALAARLLVGEHAGSVGVISVNDGGEVVGHGVVQLGGAPGAANHGIGELSVSAGGDFYSFNTIEVGNGSLISLADGFVTGASLELAKGSTVIGSGSLGAVEDFQNNGQITARGVLDLSGIISGNGVLQIGAGSALAVPENLTQAAIRFIGSHGTLFLGQNPSVDAPIAGFDHSDTIEALYADSVGFDPATDILTLYTAGGVEAELTLKGDYTGAVFHDHYAGAVGTITVSLAHQGG